MDKKFKSIIVTLFVCIIYLSLSMTAFAACPITRSNSSEASKEAIQYYNMLPESLRNQFESEGWEIIISDVATVNMMRAMYGGVSTGGYVAGFTESFSKSIILADTDAGNAINHEFGHYFDYSKGKISDTELFKDIYKAESGKFDGGNNDYAKSQVGEYFAEAFREYVECAGYLHNCCPRTYSFIDGLMLNYGGTSTNDVTSLTRCKSHIVDKVAKAAADAAAKAARNAAQGLLNSGAKVLGKNAPKLGDWVEKTQDIVDAINEDPEGYAKKQSDEWTEYLQGIDWDKKREEINKKVETKTDELNKKLEDEEYWEQKGKEAADKINNKVSEWNKKMEKFDSQKAGKEVSDKIIKFLGGKK